jgi:hypothetical protein
MFPKEPMMITQTPFRIGDRVTGLFYGAPFTGTVADVRSTYVAWVKRDGRDAAEWFHMDSLTKVIG